MPSGKATLIMKSDAADSQVIFVNSFIVVSIDLRIVTADMKKGLSLNYLIERAVLAFTLSRHYSFSTLLYLILSCVIQSFPFSTLLYLILSYIIQSFSFIFSPLLLILTSPTHSILHVLFYPSRPTTQTLNSFKRGIKSYNFECNCRLCKQFVKNLGFLRF